MAHCIIKIQGKYAIWSSVVDAPITHFYNSLDELRRDEPGEDYEEDRILRLEATGTSSWRYDSLESLIGFNRAGPNESVLTAEELLQQYT